uniref:DUF4460 domain-containing protein n=1 Tax=Dunaliella tertiolecta TaxID=3047 RepID=A0A7S3QVQ9_DUNTE|mmetsp:Transcript_95/g.210  ORF Transcript_95/g.210 Transcript_95/m.210 type:complete len:651 (-) Transcript_95:856-2808(-)
MDNASKKLTRQVIRQVHPDLFVDSPYEKQCNSESLKRLNNYVDELAKNRQPKPTTLEFFVRDGTQLKRLQAQLTPSGSLAPLFFAFELISADDLANVGGVSSADDTNFLAWLKDQVSEAVRTAERHDVMKWHIRRLKSSFEEKYGLAAVQIGAEYAVSLEEQENQVDSLTALDDAVQEVTQEKNNPNYFKHLSIQLYHTSACPQEAYSFVDDNGVFKMRTEHMKAYVGDDGALHLVADRSTLKEQIYSLDLERARMLTKVSLYWLKRVRDLTPAVTQLLGVRHVWCDTKSEQNSQKFVLWAGYLLEKREEIKDLFAGRKFAFSIIVHADTSGPLINFHQSSPILNVRADCPASHLINFLASEGGSEASKASTEVQNTRAKEEALLERVRQVFDARCVIKICMNDQVKEAAMRLLDNADVIKQVVDLRGACIALDDCYEVWDSGFISIPYNFKIEELSNMLPKLQLGQHPSSSSEPPESGPLVSEAYQQAQSKSAGNAPYANLDGNSRTRSNSSNRSSSNNRSSSSDRSSSSSSSNGSSSSKRSSSSTNGNSSVDGAPSTDNGSSNSNRSKVGASAHGGSLTQGHNGMHPKCLLRPRLQPPSPPFRPHQIRAIPTLRAPAQPRLAASAVHAQVCRQSLQAVSAARNCLRLL